MTETSPILYRYAQLLEDESLELETITQDLLLDVKTAERFLAKALPAVVRAYERGVRLEPGRIKVTKFRGYARRVVNWRQQVVALHGEDCAKGITEAAPVTHDERVRVWDPDRERTPKGTPLAQPLPVAQVAVQKKTRKARAR